MTNVDLLNQELLAVIGKIASVLEKEPALQEKLEAVTNIDSAYEIMQPYLENVTKEVFAAACETVKKMAEEAEPVKALSDDELDNVTGGGSFWSDFKKGFVGTFKVIGSAIAYAGSATTKSDGIIKTTGDMLKKNVKELSDLVHNR